MLRTYCTFLLIVTLLRAGMGVAAVRPADAQEVTPPDVLAAVLCLGDHIEVLRRYMGRPTITPLSLRVSNASPFDVYFQARTLFEKSNRLLFEIKRESRTPPATPHQNIRPADVLLLVEKSDENLLDISDFLGVVLHAKLRNLEKNKTPSDVFMAITTLNRQLNQLLTRRFSPSDVFEEVTLAIGYSELLLARYPDAERIPPPPPFVANKTPSDVYFRLKHCAKLVTSIYHKANLPTLTLLGDQVRAEEISPSDVYDIASLLVARLALLHQVQHVPQNPMEPFYPGLKFPSHVYQQAGILEQQLYLLGTLQEPLDQQYSQEGHEEEHHR